MGSSSQIMRLLDLTSDAGDVALAPLVTTLTPRISRHQRVEFRGILMRTQWPPARHVEEILITGRRDELAGLIGSERRWPQCYAKSPEAARTTPSLWPSTSNGSVDVGRSECPASPSGGAGPCQPAMTIPHTDLGEKPNMD